MAQNGRHATDGVGETLRSQAAKVGSHRYLMDDLNQFGQTIAAADGQTIVSRQSCKSLANHYSAV
jgi:hypothetical protein